MTDAVPVTRKGPGAAFGYFSYSEPQYDFPESHLFDLVSFMRPSLGCLCWNPDNRTTAGASDSY
ncbi:hypothetical protein M407DRAFT_246278 [Tulasnella calospora MUT 4182]|uniref:Uncharacterized protein n=1 Tax=Tulasnella calospora MUT 4182 TaxID=1051891 RepID=A0A0C3Q5Z9_9AGAM|nr:hypothetical protein M407DRAFT_246278 [Tulasnella calospora MUT 4182]